jgi:phospho-N-acetylmuramoyl-pentapeptide-transferase
MDFHTVTAFLLSFPISVILYLIFIPVFRRVKLGQKILEIGPSWHKSKEGTPTLGGLFFILATLATLIVFVSLGIMAKDAYGLIAVIGMALTFGMIGFIDDYVKLFKKRNKGLSPTQKLLLQFTVAAAYLWVRNRYCGGTSSVTLPLSGESAELGVFYYFVAIVLIVYIVNCANLTDGIDGLAGSVAMIMGVFFFVVAIKSTDRNAAVLTAALLGALAGFLIFNLHPAKIIMGDTGSMFLGGVLVGLTFYFAAELLLFIICFIWLMEGVSVIIQVTGYKLTKKRVFKMSPIHHHFEMCGWSEFKIVTVFSLISAVMCGLAYLLYSYNL